MVSVFKKDLLLFIVWYLRAKNDGMKLLKVFPNWIIKFLWKQKTLSIQQVTVVLSIHSLESGPVYFSQCWHHMADGMNNAKDVRCVFRAKAVMKSNDDTQVALPPPQTYWQLIINQFGLIMHPETFYYYKIPFMIPHSLAGHMGHDTESRP